MQIQQLGGQRLGVDMNREYPTRKYWGVRCSRCGSTNTFTEQYPSQKMIEYWCNCGTELLADGTIWRTHYVLTGEPNEDSS